MSAAALPRIRLPYPHAGQQVVRRQAERFNWLAAGRRWRKTTMAMTISVEAAAAGQTVIWGAPTYNQVRIGMEETRRAAAGAADFNLSRMEVNFPTGGKIMFRSLDNPDNARGYTADGIVIDECADVKPQAWYEVLRPMLIDTNGWLWALGTPKGQNWFWIEHTATRDRADSMAWQVPTLGVEVVGNRLQRKPHPLENPDIPFDEVERLFATMPERVFLQEILAQFIKSDGVVFRRVMEAATAEQEECADPECEYVIGIDWAKLADFSSFAVLNTTRRACVYLDRFNQIDYSVQMGRLKALYERFRPVTMISERNSIGEPLLEQMRRDGMPVQGFMTTNASKTAAIEGLALAFEQEALKIINDSVLVGELLAYEMERLPGGLIRYGAPQGMHDDTVMALALAWAGVGQRVEYAPSIWG